MYSRRTITLIQFIINVGYKAKYFPFKLITSNGTARLQIVTSKKQNETWEQCICGSSIIPATLLVKLKYLSENKQVIQWKFAIFGYSLIPTVFLVMGLWFDFNFDPPIEDRAQFYIALPLFLMGTVLSLQMLFYWEHFMSFFNTLFVFVEKLCKYHKLKSHYKDGLEVPILFLITVNLVVITIFPAITLTWIINNTHFASILNTGIILFTIIICVPGTLVIVVPGIVLATFFSTMAFIIVKVVATSLKFLQYNTKKELSTAEISSIIHIYRAHQVFNNMVNKRYQVLILLGYFNCGLIMITMSYSLIGFYQHLPLALIGVLSATVPLTFCVVYLCTTYAAKVYILSSFAKLSFLRNDINVQKKHQKGFIACKPIYFEIGKFCRMGMSTFPTFMHEVVISNVLNLLLM